jgi:hypothetical protein
MMSMDTGRTWAAAIAVGVLGGWGSSIFGQQYTPPPQYNIQYQEYPQSSAVPAPPVTPTTQAMTADQIDQLIAPIALYPDPLLAQLFPAATYPDDVTAAEQWVQSNGNNITDDSIAAQPWDPSVKAMVHYPTVLQMMAQQIAWTQVLGTAFTNQQQDVLASVQRLRAQAQQSGSLQSNAQQQVVADDSSIRIEPVNPDQLYVPQYDPNAVYTQDAPIDYGVPLGIGLWLSNDFNWGNGWIDVGGGWYRGWHHPPEWDRNPPRWDKHPPNYVAPAPRRWERASDRPPLQRITPDQINRAFSHPGPAAHAVVVPGRREVIGAQPGAVEQRNVFGGYQNRQDVQRAQERVQAIHAPPAVHEVPRTAEPVRPEPPRVVEPIRPAEPERIPPPVVREIPRAEPEPSRGFPSGGNAAEVRGQSDRGHASMGGGGGGRGGGRR